jgi:hypothetical protein
VIFKDCFRKDVPGIAKYALMSGRMGVNAGRCENMDEPYGEDGFVGESSIGTSLLHVKKEARPV